MGKFRHSTHFWIERIWRTIKYECIHLAGIESLIELKSELYTYILYYNNRRLHSSLCYKQPAKYYADSMKHNGSKDYLVYCELDKKAATNKEAA